MNKNLVAGLFAVGLIITGGTGFYIANAEDNTVDPTAFMQQQGMGMGTGTGQMTQMMKSTTTEEMQQLMQSENFTFDQMLPYMKKMHPDLSNEQLKALFENMHGTNGSQACSNGQGMMRNTSEF
jgi:hypothetical protein